MPYLLLYDVSGAGNSLLRELFPQIDEVQYLLSCSASDQRAALNAIEYLANQLRISIFVAGTHEAFHVMSCDGSLQGTLRC